MKRLFISVMLAVAFIAVGLGFSGKAEAKEYRFTIGGVEHVAKVGLAGLEKVSFVEKEKVVELTWANTAKKSVVAKKFPRQIIAASPKVQPVAKAVSKVKITEKRAAPAITQKVQENNISTAIKKDVLANNTADINIAKKTEIPKTIAEKMNVKKENTAPIAKYTKVIPKISDSAVAKNTFAPYSTGAPDKTESIINTVKECKAENNTIGKVEYLLFDKRPFDELRSIAELSVREESGGIIVQDIQERTREYKVPKAHFFEVRYVGDRAVSYRPVKMVPTGELIRFSESRRLPSSPGFQIIKNKS